MYNIIMEFLLEQYNIYKTELRKNKDEPYNNRIFNELIDFMKQNNDLFYYLIDKKYIPCDDDDTEMKHISFLDIWNSKGKYSLIDKYRKILGILVYGYDNYYIQQIKKTYINSPVIKPSITVKYIDKNNLPVIFYHNNS